MEQFDIYDEFGNPTGDTMNRGDHTPKGKYHLVVNIWIKNKNNEYLIQQRNKKEDKYPYMWATTAGAVSAGEDSLTGALRETVEEIGVALNKEDLHLVGRFFKQTETLHGYINDVYIAYKDVPLSSLKLDLSEVKQCKYATLDDIMKMIEANEFWDYRELAHPTYFQVLEKK